MRMVGAVWDDPTARAVRLVKAQGIRDAAATFDEIEQRFAADDGTKVDFAAHEVAAILREQAEKLERGSSTHE